MPREIVDGQIATALVGARGRLTVVSRPVFAAKVPTGCRGLRPSFVLHFSIRLRFSIPAQTNATAMGLCEFGVPRSYLRAPIASSSLPTGGARPAVRRNCSRREHRIMRQLRSRSRKHTGVNGMPPDFSPVPPTTGVDFEWRLSGDLPPAAHRIGIGLNGRRPKLLRKCSSSATEVTLAVPISIDVPGESPIESERTLTRP